MQFYEACTLTKALICMHSLRERHHSIQRGLICWWTEERVQHAHALLLLLCVALPALTIAQCTHRRPSVLVMEEVQEAQSWRVDRCAHALCHKFILATTELP